MNKVILDNIPFDISLDRLLEKLHMDAEDEGADEVGELLKEARRIARPKGMYVEAFIDSKGEDYVVVEGVKLTSRVLRVNLNDVYRIYPYAATCGTELEEWSKTINDPLQRYWADAIKEIALVPALETLRKHLMDSYHLEKVSSMNPGSLEDWPIKEQEGLFALLGDTKAAIGVELTDSFLMLPIKSVSGIWFPTETNYENCQLCPREGCPGRRAPYDKELYRRKYLQQKA